MGIGASIGAYFGCRLSNRYGRRKTILWNDYFLLVVIGLNLIPFTLVFIIARFMCGIVSGVGTSITPVYINEISPAEISGKLGSLVQI